MRRTDISGLRDYAARYMELATSDEMESRRNLWRDHNSLVFTIPPIYMRAVPYNEFFDMRKLECEDELLRGIEYKLATIVDYHSRLDDDSVYEPWVMVGAATLPYEDRWGVRCGLGERTMDGGAAPYQPSIVDERDIEKLCARDYYIDERETALRAEKVYDAVGDIIDVSVDRRGLLSRPWTMDISTDIAKIRGLDTIMYDVYDRPEWLKQLAGRMRDAVLRDLAQTEAAGGITLACHENQAMPYARELPDPSCRSGGVEISSLWGFLASQETTTFGPEQFDEFMLSFQIPIIERFGLVSYGCCEDLTRKIPMLKRIKNLRRIAISPFANIDSCAEQIGGDYIFSYRPSPSEMIATGLNEERVRAILRRDFAAMLSRGCKFDITLKDVETISGQPMNMIRWVELVREEIDRALS